MIRAGVVGWPVSHSLSPLIHGAWIHGAGLSATYDLLPAETGADFDTLVAHASDGLIQGFNVTAPWKLRALASADEATPTARRAGSANLLTFRQGRILADSTDGVGVLSALKSQAPHLSLPDARVTVLGAGGAARAAAAAEMAARGVRGGGPAAQFGRQGAEARAGAAAHADPLSRATAQRAASATVASGSTASP